jgi:hypothetical protein
MNGRTIALAALAVMLTVCGAKAEQMTVGTNIWHPGWGGTDSDPFTAGYQNVTGADPWRAAFIEEVSHYTAIRFMDLGGLNSNEAPANWAARTLQSARDQMPMAYEWMIDMCNRAQTDMWICIPYLWDVDLPGCRSLAQLIYSTLNTSHRVYVEYGNENWSTDYNQNYCRQRGVAIGLGASDQTTGDRYSAYASMKIWEEFEAVFGRGNPRLVRVLSGFVINPQTTGVQLSFLVNDTVHNPNHTRPDLYTVAPYNNMGSIAAARSNLASLAQQLRAHNTVLTRAGGIPLGCYEGGFGDSNHETMAADPAMYALTREYLDTLNAYTRGVFMHLNHSCRRWGAKMYIGEPLAQANIYRALIDWNAGHTVGTAPGTPHTAPAQAQPAAWHYLVTVDGRLAQVLDGNRATGRVLVSAEGGVRTPWAGASAAVRPSR